MKGYFVSVEGNRAPKKVHETYKEAYCEAHRLSLLKENIGKKVYIFQAREVLQSKIVVEDEFGKIVDTDFLNQLENNNEYL